MRDSAAPPPVAITAPPPPPAPAGSPDAPVALGQALPPPVEATIPAPYVTPGLPGGPEASAPAAPTAPRVLGVRAAVYGAPAEASVVTLQAVRSVSLVVHNGAGPPIFVRELTKGETYRAPNLPGLTLDVSAPDAFDVFVGGEYRGALTTPVTALSSFTR